MLWGSCRRSRPRPPLLQARGQGVYPTERQTEICIVVRNRAAQGSNLCIAVRDESAVGPRRQTEIWKTAVHDSGMSSVIFCTTKHAVVKITRVEKVQILFQRVETIYVNWKCILRVFDLVENSCGKGCGECGKVWVFNSYSASFEIWCPMWKTMNRWLHNRDPVRWPLMLRYQCQEVLSSRKSSKLLKL